MKEIWWIFSILLAANISIAKTSDHVVFQCQSRYENINLNFTATGTEVTASYTVGDGKSFKCEAPILFFNQSDSQIPTYEANIIFDRKCDPKLTSTLARTIAVEMKLIVPISKDEPPTLSWINYQKSQKCLAQVNGLKNHFKNK